MKCPICGSNTNEIGSMHYQGMVTPELECENGHIFEGEKYEWTVEGAFKRLRELEEQEEKDRISTINRSEVQQ